KAAPTSTTNMTGFLATIRGFSLTNDSFVARRMISGSNKGRDRTPLEMSGVPSVSTSLMPTFGSCGGRVAVAILKHPPVQHLEMLNNRPQGQGREIRQCAHDNDRSDQQHDEQRTMCGQCAARHGN